MNNDKQRIYSGDWKTLHPYTGSAPTDLYYITLANKVLAAIRPIEEALADDDYRKIDDNEQKELACILTAYFEDIISQTGIFQAFTRVYRRRFGKPLPFYTLDSDYTPGEINIEEVQFLIWHYHMQLNNLDVAYSPALDTFAAIAADVMALFEAEYETAPENEKLLHYFQLDEKEQHNLYALHSRFLWLCTQSYLFSNNGFLLVAGRRGQGGRHGGSDSRHGQPTLQRLRLQPGHRVHAAHPAPLAGRGIGRGFTPLRLAHEHGTQIHRLLPLRRG